MNENWITQMRKAYDDVPSQDNEGYVPERGSFKCGFGIAWHQQQQIIYALETKVTELKVELQKERGSNYD